MYFSALKLKKTRSQTRKKENAIKITHLYMIHSIIHSCSREAYRLNLINESTFIFARSKNLIANFNLGIDYQYVWHLYFFKCFKALPRTTNYYGVKHIYYKNRSSMFIIQRGSSTCCASEFNKTQQNATLNDLITRTKALLDLLN